MAFANTDTLQTNLNIDPYYDDFDESKNFHRILFRPGLAVQARELTQMQSILQNQIDRFGSHIFKEGSFVTGGEINLDKRIAFVKLRDDDAAGAVVNAAAFNGTTLTGETTRLTAYVVNTADGAEANTPDVKTVFVKYTSSNVSGGHTVFADGERIIANTGVSANLISSSATGLGAQITVGESIIFAKDHFIRAPEQTILLDKYTNTPSYKIGYDIEETIVTTNDDTTLLDPAQGSFNFTAPGANRLKLNPILRRYEVDATTKPDFAEVIRLSSGTIQSKAEKTDYARIGDFLAERTYDESGNYIIDGLDIDVKEHLKSGDNQGVFTSAAGGNTQQLAVGVGPGLAYVQGYKVRNYTTNYIGVDKGIDVESIEQVSIPANYGNYVQVNEVAGIWDINGHDVVSLRDEAMRAISNNDYSTTSTVGNQIGTARVRALEYSSGTKGANNAIYNMYLYDIKMTSGPFSSVKSIYLNNTTLADAKADTILTSGSATLNETNFNRAVFPIPASNVRRLRDSTGSIDNTFRFLKKFDVTIATDGTFTLTTGASDEQFPFSTGALNATQKRANFYVVLNEAANTTPLTGTVSVSLAANNTLSGSGTNFNDALNVGDRIKINGYANTFVVANVSSATVATVFTANGVSQINGGTQSAITAEGYAKAYGVGAVIDMSGNGANTGAVRSVTISSTTAAAFDTEEQFTGTLSASVFTELNKIDGQEAAKTYRPRRLVQLTVNQSDGSANTTGPYNLGFSDVFAVNSVRVLSSSNTLFTSTTQGTNVTSSFTFDSGQRDNFYDHGKLVIRPDASISLTAGDVLLVDLDYFAHDTSQGVGYFSVDSYPIDDANEDSTTAITTQEIPNFVSPVTGDEFDLRNSIDIRPRIQDSSTDATAVASASVNPSTSTTIVEPSGGLHFIPPNDNFQADLDFYLSRRDVIVLDDVGGVRAIRGKSGIVAATPQLPTDGMALGVLEVAPYPSLPLEQARRFNRRDLANNIKFIKNDRFTMKDIGSLKQRIDNLEYYTSLNLLEVDAKEFLVADNAGNDRFKNGIFVDNFSGHQFSDVTNLDYSAAIDKQNRELRPKFRLDDVDMNIQLANSTNVIARSKDVILTVGSGTYTNGETITVGAASGSLRYQVGTKLYLEDTSGTFSTGTSAVGGTSTTSSTVATVAQPSIGKLVTLDYAHTPLINQSFASTTRNLAGQFYNYKRARLDLNPQTDNWVDTTRSPDVIVDLELQNQNLSNLSVGWNTQWNGTTQFWRGDELIERRSGTETLVQISIGSRSFGDRVIDVSVIPFIRSRTIQFSAFGMKPGTRLYGFFDDISIDDYISPANSAFANTASEGSQLVTDTTGTVYGLFRIPNEDGLRFRTGDRQFKLTDNVNNTDENAATTAFETYTATGLNQTIQRVVAATRRPTVADQRSVATERVIDRRDNDNGGGGGDGGGDPIAQTFLVDTASFGDTTAPGVFLTKIDLYFQSKDSTQPVFVELREVDPTSSYLTNVVIPFSKTKVESADVNISSDGSSPTPVYFSSPVFLKNNTEYAVVLIPGGNNPNYNIFVSKLGQTDLITGNRINTQPFAGILFASANDRTYTPIQDEDLKMRLYFAQFEASGTLITKNSNKEFFTIANTSSAFNTVGESVHGITTITLGSSISANIGETLVGSTSGANGTIVDADGGADTTVSSTTIAVKNVTLAAKFTDGETVTVFDSSGVATSTTGTISAQATPTGKVYHYDPRSAANTYLYLANTTGTFVANTVITGQRDGKNTRIVTIDNLKADVMQLNYGKLELAGTSTSISGKFGTSASTRDASFFRVNDEKNEEFRSSRFILSRSNEVNNLSGVKSAEVQIAMATTNNRLSPVIDLDRASLHAFENLVNNDSTSEESISGGNATSKHITQAVTLADGQDAEDLRVIVEAYKPAAADVKVYYKIIADGDGDTFDDRAWTEMTQVTSTNIISDSQDRTDFKEYEYRIADAYLTGSNDEVQYINSDGVTFTGFKFFKFKIVLLSSDTANPPRVRNFRSIALQV